MIETVNFNGWKNSKRLANEQIELIVTTDVGPRIARFAFNGHRNLLAEIVGQQGGVGEGEWKIRGGHRLWIAPEDKPRSYELDNVAVTSEKRANGLRVTAAPGPVTGIAKQIDVELSNGSTDVSVVHRLTNLGTRPFELAPWALTVMAPGGMAVIPLPAKIAHTDRLTHNQEWSIWGYTDFSDPRWTLGRRYVFFRQDPTRGPNKLGIAHREGWVAYVLGEFLFVKHFEYVDGARYPDAGMNFETFSNEDFLEVESLGPIVTLQPGETVAHKEIWQLFRGLPAIATEDDADAYIRHLIEG